MINRAYPSTCSSPGMAKDSKIRMEFVARSKLNEGSDVRDVSARVPPAVSLSCLVGELVEARPLLLGDPVEVEDVSDVPEAGPHAAGLEAGDLRG